MPCTSTAANIFKLVVRTGDPQQQIQQGICTTGVSVQAEQIQKHCTKQGKKPAIFASQPLKHVNLIHESIALKQIGLRTTIEDLHHLCTTTE